MIEYHLIENNFSDFNLFKHTINLQTIRLGEIVGVEIEPHSPVHHIAHYLRQISFFIFVEHILIRLIIQIDQLKINQEFILFHLKSFCLFIGFI